MPKWAGPTNSMPIYGIGDVPPNIRRVAICTTSFRCRLEQVKIRQALLDRRADRNRRPLRPRRHRGEVPRADAPHSQRPADTKLDELGASARSCAGNFPATRTSETTDRGSIEPRSVVMQRQRQDLWVNPDQPHAAFAVQVRAPNRTRNTHPPRNRRTQNRPEREAPGHHWPGASGKWRKGCRSRNAAGKHRPARSRATTDPTAGWFPPAPAIHPRAAGRPRRPPASPRPPAGRFPAPHRSGR